MRRESQAASAPTGFDADTCIIGAGPAGLISAKSLADEGVGFDWFEKGSYVGGLWQIDNDAGSPAYRSLHLNSSRTRTEYPCYPMPSDWPDFPSHQLVASYFDDFADHFGLRGRITFRTEVTGVNPRPGPADSGSEARTAATGEYGWLVTLAGGEQRRYRNVVVANGHHHTPNLPDFPGEFAGMTMHAHDYTDPSPFAGKRVLVVGVGNSGMDISCDAAAVADRVYLSTRHGVHVIPKYALGRPVDHWTNPLFAYLPFEVERLLYKALIRVAVGRPEDRGLPKPDHELLGAHPTVSADLHDRVGHGDIIMKPDVAALRGEEVVFTDGSVEQVDVIVYATGYQVSLPFLGPEVLDVSGNAWPLYQRVVAVDRPGLYFVGYAQVVGANIPIMEYQARWVAALIAGRAALPDRDSMTTWIDQDAAAMARRYLRSARHTMQVDYWRYIRALRAELVEGTSRVGERSMLGRVLPGPVTRVGRGLLRTMTDVAGQVPGAGLVLDSGSRAAGATPLDESSATASAGESESGSESVSPSAAGN